MITCGTLDEKGSKEMLRYGKGPLTNRDIKPACWSIDPTKNSQKCPCEEAFGAGWQRSEKMWPARELFELPIERGDKGKYWENYVPEIPDIQWL